MVAPYHKVSSLDPKKNAQGNPVLTEEVGKDSVVQARQRG